VAKFIFDGPNKKIIFRDDSVVGGVQQFTVADLWREWCDWAASDNNLMYAPALDSLMVPLSATEFVGPYVFMRNDLADVSFVLDRSGSMSSVREDTIGGFNSFIEAQQKLPGECLATLMQFDDQHDVLYSGKPIKDVPKLTAETFVPRRSTALLDAIGRTIVATGARLAAMPEADRPEKVMFVILTDGGENASREFNRKQIFDMIKLQTETYKWDFVFIGANQDAIATGASLGVMAGKSMTYASNSAGTKAAFESMSAYVGAARACAGPLSETKFTAADRDEQAKAGA